MFVPETPVMAPTFDIIASKLIAVFVASANGAPNLAIHAIPEPKLLQLSPAFDQADDTIALLVSNIWEVTFRKSAPYLDAAEAST